MIAAMHADPLAAARALAPTIRARAAEIEGARALPADLAAALARAGLFRTLLPRRVGGLQTDPATALATMETVAEADASTGWCVMIGATAGMAAAWLDPEVAASIHATPETVTGGVFAPMGRAVADGDHYRVDGRWQWFSGHGHCQWLSAGCLVIDPTAAAGAPPAARMMFFPASAATPLDGWHVSGLAGTGSGEVQVGGLRVPRSHSISLVADPPRDDGALYRLPPFGLLAHGIAAVMLGNARAALAEFAELATDKRPQGGRRTLAERATVQAELARAHATLRAARAYCADAVGGAWRTVTEGGTLDPAARADLRMAATFATRSAADVARTAYDLGGGSSVFLSSPLQRRFRDAHVGTQHAMIAPATWELAGRVLLGLPTDTAQL